MKVIKDKKILLIPDVHQCIGGFIKPIFETEADWDHVVFMGDWFDCSESIDNEAYYNVTLTCKWINEHFEKWKDKSTWLLGNHDLAYISTYNSYGHKIPPKGSFYTCSGWTRNKARAFNQKINPEWINALELCVQVEDRIISHAGFHRSKFSPSISEIENIRTLYNLWEGEKHTFKNKVSHWIMDVGSSRGGWCEVGSPVWLDFNMEFQPLETVRQIVGHTNGKDPKQKEFDENNIDYCIDAYRTCYGVYENAKLILKRISNE